MHTNEELISPSLILIPSIDRHSQVNEEMCRFYQSERVNIFGSKTLILSEAMGAIRSQERKNPTWKNKPISNALPINFYGRDSAQVVLFW
jgi:hypothetical protein